MHILISGFPGLGGLDLGSLLTNPAIMNMVYDDDDDDDDYDDNDNDNDNNNNNNNPTIIVSRLLCIAKFGSGDLQTTCKLNFLINIKSNFRF